MIAPVAAPNPPPASTPFSRVLSGCEQLANRTTAAKRVSAAQKKTLSHDHHSFLNSHRVSPSAATVTQRVIKVQRLNQQS